MKTQGTRAASNFLTWKWGSRFLLSAWREYGEHKKKSKQLSWSLDFQICLPVCWPWLWLTKIAFPYNWKLPNQIICSLAQVSFCLPSALFCVNVFTSEEMCSYLIRNNQIKKHGWKQNWAGINKLKKKKINFELALKVKMQDYEDTASSTIVLIHFQCVKNNTINLPYDHQSTDWATLQIIRFMECLKGLWFICLSGVQSIAASFNWLFCSACLTVLVFWCTLTALLVLFLPTEDSCFKEKCPKN